MTTRIKLRRDTLENWTTNNPVLALGEPGLDTDSNQVKYGDGTTAWNDLSYASGGASTANRVQAVYWSDALGLYSTTTVDGKNWTSPVTIDFEFGPYGADTMAVGPMGTVFSYGSMWGPYLTHQASPFEMPMACQPSAILNLGPAGEEIWWNRVRYVGGYYIALGGMTTTTVVTSPNITIPYWAYSTDGKNWTLGDVNAADLETIVDTENGSESQVTGLEFTDVAYNGTGWFFSCEWTYSYPDPENRPGGFYITNIGATLSSSNYSNNAPFLDIVKWADTGWVGIKYDWQEVTLYSIANTNPLATTWTAHNADGSITTQLGPWPGEGYAPGIYGMDVGTIDGTTYVVFSTDYGRAAVTTDLGVTWHAVVPNPKTERIIGFSTGTDGNSLDNVPMIELYSNPAIAEGEKITISGGKVSGMNGTWYIGAQDGTSGYYFIYPTAAMNTAASTTGWGIDTISIIVSATYGSTLVSVSDTTNLRAGMYMQLDAPLSGKIIAVDTDNNTITLDTPSWDDIWNYEGPEVLPMTTFSTGVWDTEAVVFNDSGYFLMNEYLYYGNSGWSKSTDPINSWNGGQSYDPAWSSGFDGLLDVSSNRVTLPATSWGYTDPMFQNSVSTVSLTDKFQVSLGGGGRWSPPCTMNLVMDPGVVGWSLGATTDGGPYSGDLGTISSFDTNDVRMSINDYRLGIDYNGKIILPTGSFGNNRTGSPSTALIFKKYNENGYNYQKIIGTEPGNSSDHDVERLVISGGDSYSYSSEGTVWQGEGGDIYLWAGKGEDGGDIKIDGGESTGTYNEGGYVKVRGGYAGGASANGGFVEVLAGDSANAVGGLLDLQAGDGNVGGNVQIYGGTGTTTGGNITIGAGSGTSAAGDIVLTILGTANSWTFGHLGGLTLPSGGTISYTPATSGDWAGTAPTTIQAAIDRLAAVVKTLNGGTGA